ncbi:MAG: ABC transporter ATP-binding protein [Rhodospirillaceae bacterium]
MPDPLLKLHEVNSFYGRIQALRGISIDVFAGEIVTLIGANGAGKTTTLMTICGQPKPVAGQIFFNGQNIHGLSTDKIAHLGIAHVPEGRRIFPGLTVLENLQMGAIASPSKEPRKKLDEIFDLFPRLADRQSQRGGTLSGGEQQMLSIGRALMAEPDLLLLDEPSLGLAPIIVKQIFEIIQRLRDNKSMTILLVEQNAYQALQLSDRGYVLVNGQVILSGDSKELLNNEQVRNAYLDGTN